MTSVRLLSVLTLAFIGVNAIAEDRIGRDEAAVILHEARSVTELLENLNTSAKCGGGTSVSEPDPLSPEGYLAFVNHSKCDALTSLEPPAWVRAHPDAGIFKTSANWHPICSWTQLKRANPSLQVSQQLSPPGLEAGAGLLRAQKNTMALDMCARGEKGMRGFSKYIPPSQESRGLSPLSENARKKWLVGIKDGRARVAEACCGKDQTCRKGFESVEIKFCEPQKDPKAPDPCTSSGTYYRRQRTNDSPRLRRDFTRMTEREIRKEVKGRFEIVPGSIHLSPLGKNDIPDNNDFQILHEFAHACSFFRRDQAINAAWMPAVREFVMKYSPGRACELGEDAMATYRRLFEEHDASRGTSACLVDVAQKAGENRFVAGKCPGGCPRSQIEESSPKSSC